MITTNMPSGGGGSNSFTEITTDAGMSALLISSNVGKVYRFTGTTGTYANGDFYIVEDNSGSYRFRYYKYQMPIGITITGTGSDESVMNHYASYIVINGVHYTTATSYFEIGAGTPIYIYGLSSWKSAYPTPWYTDVGCKLNGSTIGGVSDTEYNFTLLYTHILNSPITINLVYGTVSGDRVYVNLASL